MLPSGHCADYSNDIPVRVLSLQHVSVIVADTARALAFYRDLLGIPEVLRPELGYPGAWLQVGDLQIHLLELANPDPVADRPLHVGRDRHLALVIDDVDACAQCLEAVGCEYTRSRSGRRALFCRDPDGNGIELIEQPGAKS